MLADLPTGDGWGHAEPGVFLDERARWATPRPAVCRNRLAPPSATPGEVPGADVQVEKIFAQRLSGVARGCIRRRVAAPNSDGSLVTVMMTGRI